ncbi:MAG: HD domain-containing protein [Oscillospiraceae bacterium]|nr:HD domain-containing protein [Oscillospiraceae bacterium]
MQLTKNEKMINIMENTLNHMDARLVDHGKRVAYLMYRVLNPLRKYERKRLRDILILGMLHDIGAYKTEEVDKMVIFETVDVWEHSIYGYLFLKYFSPLEEMSPIILYHHADCDELKNLDNPEYQVLAQLISLCDRADVFSLHGGSDKSLKAYLNQQRDIKYRSDVVDMFLSSGVNIDTAFDEIDTDAEFYDSLFNTHLTDDEVSGYIKMIIYSIDFRSSQTVIHTVGTVCISGMLASLLGADSTVIEKIQTGAMLHDIGKIGIPLNILESPGKLSDAEMDIMKTHVTITGKILKGNVDEDIKNIAVNHHEKINGTGYPNQLESKDISFSERIVSIADIFGALYGTRSYKNSFSKEKIVGILSDMSSKDLIDQKITAMAVERFDDITEEIEKEAKPIIQAYDEMNNEYASIRADLKRNK